MTCFKQDAFSIWITIESDNPDLQDFAKAQAELESSGIKYEGRLGIGLTRQQWVNLLRNLSRFEQRFVQAIPASIFGFPVRMIEVEK